MCANPAVSADDHAAANNRARTDPTARSYLCSGLNHRQRPDLRRRIDARSLRDNCGRMDTGRNCWQRIEECSNARPCRVWFDGLDRHCPGGHSRRHIRMHDHGTGRCLIECRRITSIIQKTHFIRAGRLQRGHTFKDAVRDHPQPRVPYSQQLQASMVQFGERTLHCPKLLQPSAFPASEPVQLVLPFYDWRR